MSIVRNRLSVKVKPRRFDLAGVPRRYFNPGELEAFLSLVESVWPETVVEFGVNNGRNPLATFRNVASVKRYVGVEVEPGYVPSMRVQRRELPAVPGELVKDDGRFELITRKRGSFDLAPEDLPTCDAVFIDADHSRAAVLNDYALAKAITREGGIIIFHDDNCLPVVEVTQAVNELCEAGAKIQHVEGTWLAFERV